MFTRLSEIANYESAIRILKFGFPTFEVTTLFQILQ